MRIPEEPAPRSSARRLYAFPVGETNTGVPPDAGAAATARANADARAKVLAWARRSIDLIPTPWLITGAGAVLLAGTAVFGGLEAAPVEPTPELAVGETYTGSDLEITVIGVELRDDRGNAMVFPEEEKGERVLVVEIEVVNTFPRPRSSYGGIRPSPSVDGIRLEGNDEDAAISYAADGGGATKLQPDVPTRLLLAWLVGPGDLQDGDTITMTLPASTHTVGDNVLRGQDYWADVHVGATVTATVEEVTAP